MKNLTKRAIQESFLRLLKDRPLAQITVKDIVEDCGVNRNTFYYHYEDIPALIREIITEEAGNIITQYPAVDNIESFLKTTLTFTLQQKKLVYHIYGSVHRDIFEHYLSEICKHFSAMYIDEISKGRKINAADKDLIIRLHKAMCFGIVMEWISGGMKENILEDVHRVCFLLEGYADNLLARCELQQIDK